MYYRIEIISETDYDFTLEFPHLKKEHSIKYDGNNYNLKIYYINNLNEIKEILHNVKIHTNKKNIRELFTSNTNRYLNELSDNNVFSSSEILGGNNSLFYNIYQYEDKYL